MAKNSPSTLNSKTCRISLHTYSILHEMSEHTGISIAEALDDLLWDTKTIPKTVYPAVVAVSKPIVGTISKPVLSINTISKPVLSINGDKHVAVVACRAKGGKIHE